MKEEMSRLRTMVMMLFSAGVVMAVGYIVIWLLEVLAHALFHDKIPPGLKALEECHLACTFLFGLIAFFVDVIHFIKKEFK